MSVTAEAPPPSARLVRSTFKHGLFHLMIFYYYLYVCKDLNMSWFRLLNVKGQNMHPGHHLYLYRHYGLFTALAGNGNCQNEIYWVEIIDCIFILYTFIIIRSMVEMLLLGFQSSILVLCMGPCKANLIFHPHPWFPDFHPFFPTLPHSPLDVIHISLFVLCS